MTDETTAAKDSAPEETGEQPQTNEAETTSSETKTTKRPPRRKTSRKKTSKSATEASSEEETSKDADPSADSSQDTEETAGKKKRRSRKKTTTKAKKEDSDESSEEAENVVTEDESSEAADASSKSKKTRSRKKTRSKSDQGEDDKSEEESEKTSSKSKPQSKRRSSRPRRFDRQAIEVTPVGPTCEPGARTMLVDDQSGEECRIAILEDGSLEELYIERTATATSVGNIYKGRVTNVESAIQAAFVDYGHGQNGFLHVSDLHPRYFPGGDKTEKVGRKTPRRERPPIQDALKKGQEILVQVLKQGVGTKGPTLTSYLSIPGRLLVMMPGMDRVGVSRKVEDDEQRREMRRILDDLNLPEGFGFILRTAGFERGKTELKRDAAYLQRLWKQMEKRMNSVGAPAELYTEGNLLVRTIRDMVDPSIGAIITNSPESFDTTSSFLSVVAPRSAPPVYYYDQEIQLFEQYGVEKQVDRIHSREVSLKSGGALVIDQTEALVAIDVNSGRSRSATDSETNAYNTNCEAVDEIARQLRLRDQGGLVICDLIDMRQERHRKDIENRLAENLRRDRARTTFLPISEFGIVEMTRQRMRPSMRSMHFTNCNACKGIGELRSADSIAADTIRNAASLLGHERVRRVEIVCSPRTASSLLSSHRRRLERLEHRGKRIDVRISETIGVDSFDLYAYDERNSDLDTSRFARPKPPRLDSLRTEIPDDVEVEVAPREGSKRRRRRRKPEIADATSVALSGGFDIPDEPEEEIEANDSPESGEDQPTEGRKRRRRRRRRRGRGNRSEEDTNTETTAEGQPEAPAPAEPAEAIRVHIFAKELDVSSKEILDACREHLELELKTHMSSVPGEFVERIRSIITGVDPTPEAPIEAATENTAQGDAEPSAAETTGAATSEGEDGEEGDQPKKKRRRRRRRRRRGGRGDNEESSENTEGSSEEPTDPETSSKSTDNETSPADSPVETEVASAPDEEVKPKPKPKRRGLYASQRRTVAATSIDRDNR